MPKTRKTRKQKLRTDQKKHVVVNASSNVTTTPIPTHTFSFTPATIAPSTPGKPIEIMSYHYLVKDLRKTLLLTLFIIVMEFVLAYGMR